MMLCPACDEEIRDNAKICPACGENIAEYLATKESLLGTDSDEGIQDMDQIIDIDMGDEADDCVEGSQIIDTDIILIRDDIGFENQVNKCKELRIAESKLLINNIDEAMPILQHLAKSNDGRAFYFLGDVYERGTNSIAQDHKKAEALWKLGHSLKDFLCTLRLLQGEELKGFLDDNRERIDKFIALDDPFVNVLIADSYYNPNGIDEYTNFCLDLWEKAGNAGYWRGYFQLALYYDKNVKSSSSAEFYYQKAADCGYGQAAIILADIYSGNADSEEQIFSLYSRAALDGNPEALNKVGECYYKGIGTEHDYELAFKYFSMSAEAGFAVGEYNLAQCYILGNGTEQNEILAFRYCLRAAEKNLAVAQNRLAFMYKFGQGTIEDEYKAFYWFEQAAEHGLDYAMYNLARCYETGEGTIADYNMAASWYQMASEKGNSDAQYRLGCFYEGGIAVEYSERKAIKLFEAAASQNHVEAMGQLASYYLTGHGVARNPQKAVELYKRAADQGDNYSQNELGMIYFQGNCVEQDFDKAFQLFSVAAEDDYPEALYNIGFCYAHGYGACKNLKKAEIYCRLALKNGYEEAGNLLKDIVESSGRIYQEVPEINNPKVRQENDKNSLLRNLIKDKYNNLIDKYRKFYMEPNISDIIKSEAYNDFVAKLLTNSGLDNKLKDILIIAPDCRRVGTNYLDSVVFTTDAICTKFGWCIPLKIIEAVDYEGNTLYVTYKSNRDLKKVAISDMYLGVAIAPEFENLIMDMITVAKR